MKKLIDLIKQLGLNEYESKAYVALLNSGTSTAGVVSEKAGIPRARVYDVLVSLQNKGFISHKPVKPVKYSAFPLKKVLVFVKSRKEHDMKTHFSELDSIVSSLQSQLQEHPENAFNESAVLIAGKKNINSIIFDSSSKPVFVGSKESIDSFKEHASRKKFSFSSVESSESKFVLLDKDSVLLYLNHSFDEKEEKALLINSSLVAGHFNSFLKKK
ncbi:MAG: helix-turn-helix domain-containing protein [Candidatus Diapherotrites archaeon]